MTPAQRAASGFNRVHLAELTDLPNDIDSPVPAEQVLRASIGFSLQRKSFNDLPPSMHQYEMF